MKEVTLDLHGVKHEDVSQVCHEFVNLNWGNEMRIITGYSAKMKKLVSEALEIYDLELIYKSAEFPFIKIRS
tara:strand:+ start:155 stop:370 length:216 start_codon:yes stop_codon:yes gene_type:complete